MKGNHSLMLGLLVALAAASPPDTTAQSADQQRSHLAALKDSIKEENQEIQLLQHFLEAATVDARLLRNANVKAWVIANPEVRDSLFEVLMVVDSSVESEAGSPAVVLATQNNDLIEVRYGNAVFKGTTLKNALDRSSDKTLYRKVAESYRYSKDVELRNPSMKLPTERPPEPMQAVALRDQFALVKLNNPHPAIVKGTVSLFDAAFKVAPDWGGEFRLGNDEIGLPFWSSGNMTLLATYQTVKFGFQFPFTGGTNASTFAPGLKIQRRPVNGTSGLVGEADFGPFGGFISVSQLNAENLSGITNRNNFAYVTGIVQLYYSFGVSLDEANFLRFKGGVGMHRAKQAQLTEVPAGQPGTQTQDQIIGLGTTDVTSPYFKFEYVNRGSSERWAASVQFYDLTLMFRGLMEVIPNYVSIEFKYVFALSQELPSWRPRDFFMISPRVRFWF